jgi:hypothetical protein
MKHFLLLIIIILTPSLGYARVPPENWKGCPPNQEKIQEAEVILQVKLLRYINTKHDITFNGKKYAVFAEYEIKKIWKGQSHFKKNSKIIIETQERNNVLLISGEERYKIGDNYLIFARPCTKKQDRHCEFSNQFQIVQDKNGYCPNRIFYHNDPEMNDFIIKGYQLDKLNKGE